MDIWDYMEGYDRELDGDVFDMKLWEAMQEEEFELDDEFENYCRVYGINDIHAFLRGIRIKAMLNNNLR